MIRLRKNNPQPYYLQVKEELQRLLASGQYNGGKPLPDERTLAAKLGLARMTLRRALGELAAEGLLERIPGRGTFVREHNIRKPSSGPRRQSIALVAFFGVSVNPRDSLFYFNIIQGMQRACGELATLNLIDAASSDLESRLLNDGASGAIALGISDKPLLKKLVQYTIPMCLCDCVHPPIDGRYDLVTHANEEGGYLATKHMLERGHRDIALVIHGAADEEGKTFTEIAAERREGYLRAMSEYRLEPPPENIIPAVAASSAAYRAFAARLKSGAKAPTAVVCSTDEGALGVIEAARDFGLNVPGDLSVTGFGDIGLFTRPELSTIRMQMEESGVQSIRMLSERMAERQLPSRTLRLSVQFIERSSTASIANTTVPKKKTGGKKK